MNAALRRMHARKQSRLLWFLAIRDALLITAVVGALLWSFHTLYVLKHSL